jgi:hypothetical protein
VTSFFLLLKKGLKHHFFNNFFDAETSCCLLPSAGASAGFGASLALAMEVLLVIQYSYGKNEKMPFRDDK